MARLLVIDDEGDIRHLFAAELEDEGYEVVTARDIAGASALLESQGFDLVILDIQLGQESGLALLQALARQKESPPVILCTAFNTYRDDFSSWLAEAYVVKSSNLDELKREVKQALARHSGVQAP